MSNKTKKWRSAIAMVLVICMLFTIFPVAAFADTTVGGIDTGSSTINYVSLGDSMTNGYGLTGYNGNTGVEDYGYKSYANQFAEWLGSEGATVNHTQLAMSAMRAEDLHWLLEVDYTDSDVLSLIQNMEGRTYNGGSRLSSEDTWKAYRDQWYQIFTNGDYWTWDELVNDYRFRVAANYINYYSDPNNTNTDIDLKNGGWSEYDRTMSDKVALQKVAKYYQDSVADADIISLGIGNGNFGVFMFGRLQEAINFGGQPGEVMIYDIEDAIRECDPQLQAYLLNLVDELSAILEEQGIVIDDGDPDTTTTMEALANTVLYGGVSFVLNYAGTVEAILQLNPDAEIIMVGLMNTFQDNGEVDGISLYDLMQAIMTPMNNYIAALPTVMQLTGNGVYADATFYYAEADYIENLAYDYGNAMKQEGSVLRERFVTSIVGEDDEAAMVWTLMRNALSINLPIITLNDVTSYESNPLSYIGSNGEDKTTAVVIYLALEKAILASKDAPISVESILNVSNLDASMFTPVMAAYTANCETAIATYLSDTTNATAVFTAVAQMSGSSYVTADKIKDLYEKGDTNTVNAVNSICTALVTPDALSAALTADATISGLMNLYATCMIANGVGGHPSENGHDALFEAVRDAYANGYTAQDEVLERLMDALALIVGYVQDNPDKVAQYALLAVDKAGLTEDVMAVLQAVDNALDQLAIELNLTDLVNGYLTQSSGIALFSAGATPTADEQELAQAIAAVKLAIAAIGNDIEAMDADALLTDIAAFDAAVQHLLQVLTDQAVSGGNAAVQKVLNDACKALDTFVQALTKETYNWVMTNYPDIAKTLKNTLYELATKAGDDAYWYLYNNPDKVVGFINEYGDDMLDLLDAYGPYALAAMGYIAENYGEDILRFAINNMDEIIEVTATLLEKHGENAAELIQVYAEYLGYCDTVRAEISRVQAELEALQDELQNELQKQLNELNAQLASLQQQLQNAADDAKAEIEKQIAQVEDLIDDVNTKIEQIEKAIDELEAQLAKAQKELEKAEAALQELLEDINEAVEKGAATIAQITAAVKDIIAEVDDTIAGVKTAVEGMVAAMEDTARFIERLMAEATLTAEQIADIIDAIADLIDGVKSELESGDIEAAIEALRNQLTDGYEELYAMLEAIDVVIAEELEEIVADLEDVLAQAEAEFKAAMYAATHGTIPCDATTYAVSDGKTVTNENGYAAQVAKAWGLNKTESLSTADVILYQVDPQIFVEAVLAFDATTDWSTYVTDETVLAYIEQARAELKAYIAEEYGAAVDQIVEPMVDRLLFAVVDYAVRNIATIEQLHEANEDALIVTVGMYNPLQGLNIIVDDTTIDVEALTQYLIEVTDVYNLLYAMASGNTVFVDVCEAEVDGLQQPIVIGDASNYNSIAAALNALMRYFYSNPGNLYANEAGHAYIAEQLLNAIEKAEHETSWDYDDNEHWQVCANCDTDFGTDRHSYSSDQDTDCDICGYVRTIADPEVTTSSILVYYLNETGVEIQTKAEQEVTTTSTYTFDVPATITFNGVTYDYDTYVDVDSEDNYVPKVSGNTLSVAIDTMPEAETALVYQLKYKAQATDPESVAVTGVTLNKTTLSLTKDSTETLTATVSPDNATNNAVTWSSSNPFVATVDANGKVTAVAKGSATITATTVDGGFTATCSVTVSSGGTTGGGGGSTGGGSTGSGGGAAIKPTDKDKDKTDATLPGLKKDPSLIFMGGYADKLFRPDAQITRGEVAAVFARLLDAERDASKVYISGFTDVPTSLWCANDIGFVKQFGLLAGYEDGTFRPNNPITRAELVAIVSRFVELTDGYVAFHDVAASHWAAGAIHRVAAQGWAGGYEDGTFRPDNYITRAEFATILCRMLGYNTDASYVAANYELTNTFSDVTPAHWAYWNIMAATNSHK